MDLSLLPAVTLGIAEARGLDEVLQTIVEAVSSQEGVGLARLWLIEGDEGCPVCRGKAGEKALHLRASAGAAREAGVDWKRCDGRFHRIGLEGKLKVSHIARTGEPLQIRDLQGDREWLREPEWAVREGLVAMAARPLIFKGEVLGVLLVFRRVELDETCWEWIRILADHAAVAIANARAYEAVERLTRELELERDYLRSELAETGSLGGILGKSAALRRVLEQVELVAGTEANVLVTGESGSGKELFARAIHERSRRAGKSLVRVNCGAIPKELFESEFFGHKKGSFTGAVADRVGRFQLAHGGTLFLDEVGEIPLDLQPKLLRVLQEGEYERVGEEVTRRVDVRVVAATNRDLEKEVAAGRFRLDLFYRLNVFPLAVPPLRERLEDVEMLALHFVEQAARRFHLPSVKVPAREIEKLRGYAWPGNVRELQNVAERAVVLARGRAVEFDLPEGVAVAARGKEAAVVIREEEWVERQRENIRLALRLAGGKVAGAEGAAARLGLSPSTLVSRMKALGIEKS